MQDIEIAVAIPEDVRGVKEVQYKAWLATYPNDEAGITVDDIEDRYRDAFTEESIRKREDQYRNPPSFERIFVAKHKDRVVGFCMMHRFEEKNQLRAIYILPEYQGQGIGRRLWEKASKFLDPDLDTAVEVATYNAGAIRFYKKLGFEDSGKRWADEKFKMKSGAVIPEMEMIKNAKVTPITHKIV